LQGASPLIKNLLRRFQDVFPKDLPAGLPPQRAVDHRIELQPGQDPPFGPQYRLSFEDQEELKQQLVELLAKGFIQPSTSPYGAPILFVQKKDGASDFVLTTEP